MCFSMNFWGLGLASDMYAFRNIFIYNVDGKQKQTSLSRAGYGHGSIGWKPHHTVLCDLHSLPAWFESSLRVHQVSNTTYILHSWYQEPSSLPKLCRCPHCKLTNRCNCIYTRLFAVSVKDPENDGVLVNVSAVVIYKCPLFSVELLKKKDIYLTFTVIKRHYMVRDVVDFRVALISNRWHLYEDLIPLTEPLKKNTQQLHVCIFQLHCSFSLRSVSGRWLIISSITPNKQRKQCLSYFFEYFTSSSCYLPLSGTFLLSSHVWTVVSDRHFFVSPLAHSILHNLCHCPQMSLIHSTHLTTSVSSGAVLQLTRGIDKNLFYKQQTHFI